MRLCKMSLKPGLTVLVCNAGTQIAMELQSETLTLKPPP